jgi:hypothetical protein
MCSSELRWAFHGARRAIGICQDSRRGRQARLQPGKRNLLPITLCGALILAGCSGAKRPGSPPPDGQAARAPETTDHADDACYNAYYPVSPDKTLEYRATFTGGMPPYSYTVSFSDMSPHSFARHEESSTGETVDTTWKCEDGGLSAEQYGDLSISQSRLRLDTMRASGVLFPPAQKWQKGSKWECSYDVKGKMTFGNTTRSVDVEGKVSVSSTIVSDELVTVPAGSFDTLKVVSTINQSLRMNGASSMPFEITFKVTSWYARDVGMVRTASTDIRQATELVTYQ